jgi:hypothetical protein
MRGAARLRSWGPDIPFVLLSNAPAGAPFGNGAPLGNGLP